MTLVATAFPFSIFATEDQEGFLTPGEEKTQEIERKLNDPIQIRATRDKGLVPNTGEEGNQIKTPEELGFEFDVETCAITKDIQENRTDLVIPEKVKVDGKVYTVKAVGEDEGWRSKNILGIKAKDAKETSKYKSITLPDTIEEIKDNAFEGVFYRNEVGNIVFPDSLKKIGERAFRDNKFKKLTIPDNVETVGEAAFENSEALEEVTFQGAQTEIGVVTFKNSNKLKKVTLPKELKVIGGGVFTDCSSLNQIDIPKTVTIIYSKAFSKNTTLNFAITEEEFNNMKGFAEDLVDFNKTFANSDSSQESNLVPDKALQKAINVEINEDNAKKIQSGEMQERNMDDPISKKDLESLTSISAREVESLEGLQYAKNLDTIGLPEAKFTDLSPIKDLKGVDRLGINVKGSKNTELKDFSPLKNWDHPYMLWIENTGLKDLSFLENKTLYNYLYLNGNEIEDVSVLKTVHGIPGNKLTLTGNKIKDFSPLKRVKAFRTYTNDKQRTDYKAETAEFNNPLINSLGSSQPITEIKGLVKSAGDYGEKIQILAKPKDGSNFIKIPYGNQCVLTLDISEIKDQLAEYEAEDVKKQEVTFKIFANEKNQKGEDVPLYVERHGEYILRVFDKEGTELENTNAQGVKCIWDLPNGDYSYQVSKKGYKGPNGEETITGNFTVKDQAKKIEINLYVDHQAQTPYPYFEELWIEDRATGDILGRGVIDSNTISVVVQSEEARQRMYSGKAQIKGKAFNALEVFAQVSASPESSHVERTKFDAFALERDGDTNHTPFKKDSATYIELYGTGGKWQHYYLFVKENPDQYAVLFRSPSYKNFPRKSNLGSLTIRSKENPENGWDVSQFVQLVDKNKIPLTPEKYVEKEYPGYIAVPRHGGGTFTGWYLSPDFKEKYNFDKAFNTDESLYIGFDNVESMDEMSDLFTVEISASANVDKYVNKYYKTPRDTDWKEMPLGTGRDAWPKVKVGEELQFKIVPKDEYALAFVQASYDGHLIPIEQISEYEFKYKPVPAQDRFPYNDNIVNYGLVLKEKSKRSEPFALNKQHNISMVADGVRMFLDQAISSKEYYTLGQAGDNLQVRVNYYDNTEQFNEGKADKKITLENFGIKTVSDNVVTSKLIKTEKNPHMIGQKTNIYQFTMPNEDIIITAKGQETGLAKLAYAQFNFKDKEGNPIAPEKIEKLVVYTDPYGSKEIKDISKAEELWTNTNVKYYTYMVTVKDKGKFYGDFEWNGSPREITLTLDVNKDTGKTEKDVQNLMDIAKGLLEDKNYPKESLEKLEKAIGEAKGLSQKQNFEKAHEVLSKAIDEVLEGNQPDVPEVPDKPKEKDFGQAKDSLKKAVDKADKLKEEDYTKATWAVFANALRNAKSELQLAKKAEDLEKAEKALNAAQGQLKAVQAPEGKNFKEAKDKLDTAIKEAEKLKKEDYTKETWEDFENALKNAKSEAKFDKATVKSLEKAKKDLKDAQDKLKKVDAVTEEAEKINQDHKDLVKNAKFTDMLDVSGHWAETYIKYVMDRGYLVGTSKHYFSPNRDTTRAEFVTVLARLAGVKEENYKKNQFTDVPKGVYYEAAVNWAEDKGIVLGVGDKKFAPNQTMTREEMATILDRYIEKTSKVYSGGQEQSFKDQGNIASWAKDSVKRMTKAGILEGTDQGKFEPKANFSRSELAAVIYRLDK